MYCPGVRSVSSNAKSSERELRQKDGGRDRRDLYSRDKKFSEAVVSGPPPPPNIKRLAWRAAHTLTLMYTKTHAQRRNGTGVRTTHT